MLFIVSFDPLGIFVTYGWLLGLMVCGSLLFSESAFAFALVRHDVV